MTRCNCQTKHRRWCPNRRIPITPAALDVSLATVPTPPGRSPVDPALDWHEQRERWNREGYCAREACGAKHKSLRNSGNGLLYCRYCAHKIAEGSPVTFEETTNAIRD